MPNPDKHTPRQVLGAFVKPAADLARNAGSRLRSRGAINGRSISLRNADPISYGLATLILLALILVLVVNGREAQGDENQTTTTAKRGVVELTSSGSGSIESARNTDLNFETSGKVVEVYVEEGDRIKKGDPIARVDDRSAELAVEEAEANLEDAENGTSTTTTGVSYSGGSDTVQTDFAVYNGSDVTTVAVLSDSGVPQVSATTGTTDSTDETGSTGEEGPTGPTGPTGATGAPGPSTPTEVVPDDGGVPTEEPDTESEMPSTGGMSGGSVSGSSMSGGSTSTESSETTIARAELELEEAEEALKATVLRAPYSGTIVSLEGAVGDTVSAGSTTSTSTESEATDSGSTAAPATGTESTGSTSTSSAFAVLQQLDALEMEVSVSEADINQIHNGQRATVTISAAEDEQLAATVSNVGLLASTDSSGVVTYPVTVRINQVSDLVKPGMTATVSIVIDQVSGAITVPNQALSGNSIEIVDGDSTRTQTVETGLVGDSTTEILSGLEDGQEIAIPQAEATTSEMPSAEAGGLGDVSGGFPSGGAMPGGGSMPSPPSGGFPG